LGSTFVPAEAQAVVTKTKQTTQTRIFPPNR
jgi:hypothetical protein